MSLLETALPEVRAARVGVKAIGIALAAAAIAFLIWWIFIHPGQLARQAAQSKVDAKLSGAGADAAVAAIGEQVVHDRETMIIRESTKEGENAVRSAAGAEVHSPDVAAALRAALCGMRAYQSEPDCAAVPADRGSVGPALENAGSAAPER